jgi:membrane associated rhomboid family serine protease
MAFLVYGRNRRTGEIVRRFDNDARTEDRARRAAEALGIHVTVVVADPNREVLAHALAKPLKPEGRPTPAVVLASEAVTFQRELRNVTPNTPVTYTLIAINFTLYILMVFCGVSIENPNLADLLHWGANFGPKTFGGEPWRLFTSMFVHVGLMHVLSNMIVFAYVGPTVERMFGNVGFLLLFVASGLAGALWATYWNPMEVEAGASGAVFGVYGALIAVLLREHDSIPPHVASKLMRFAMIFVLYNLVNSLRPGISMSAHIGGLVVGFFAGIALAQPISRDVLPIRPLRDLIAAVLGGLLFAAGIAGVHARYPNLDRLHAALQQFSQVELTIPKRIAEIESRTERENIDSIATALRGAGLLADNATTNDENLKVHAVSARMTGTALANAIENDFLPAWRAARELLDTLKPIPAPMQGDVGVILDYMNRREENWRNLAYAWRANDKAAIRVGEHAMQDLDKIAWGVRRLPSLRLPLD